MIYLDMLLPLEFKYLIDPEKLEKEGLGLVGSDVTSSSPWHLLS